MTCLLTVLWTCDRAPQDEKDREDAKLEIVDLRLKPRRTSTVLWTVRVSSFVETLLLV